MECQIYRMPEDMPDKVPECMPDRMAADLPDNMPEDMLDRMPDGMPEDLPDNMPEDMLDRMPDGMPEDLPDNMPEHLPEDMPEHLPENKPGRMPEDMPEDMPDRMPENMSDRMPEDLPVTKCINVMVGITRSKVIYRKPFCSQRWHLNLANFFKQGHGDLRPKRLPKKRYTDDQSWKPTHKYRTVLSQILPEKSLLQSAAMSVSYFDGPQPLENRQYVLVLACLHGLDCGLRRGT